MPYKCVVSYVAEQWSGERCHVIHLPQVVVDVGCGTGILSLLCAKLGGARKVSHPLSTEPLASLVPRLYPCARTQTNRALSDWSEYKRTGKAWERG